MSFIRRRPPAVDEMMFFLVGLLSSQLIIAFRTGVDSFDVAAILLLLTIIIHFWKHFG